ncbi:hypothetical protein [Geodermatophilus sp. SYSU D01105]
MTATGVPAAAGAPGGARGPEPGARGTARADGPATDDHRGRATETADGAPESAVAEATTALPQLLRVVGAVVAPTTLVTALLFYLGRAHATALVGYFGVPVTVLDLTVNDQLFRSIDVAGLPVVLLLGLALLALWTHQVLSGTLPDRLRGPLRTILAPVAAVTGAVLVSLSLAATLGAWRFPFGEGRGLALSIGVLLLAYAARLARMSWAGRRAGGRPGQSVDALAVAQGCVVFLLVAIGLFWAAGSYAGGVGRLRAQQFASTLVSAQPDTVLYSAGDLSLRGPGITELRCADDAAYRYRYTGLSLLIQSGSQYLLLPKAWNAEYGRAILIPRDERVRLEFGQPGVAADGTC